MQCYVKIITRIEARHDECLDKRVYPFMAANDEAEKKFNDLVRETLLNLAFDYLEDELENPEEVDNQTIVEMLENEAHYPTLHDDYFGFIHAEGTREIEIDMERYLAK